MKLDITGVYETPVPSSKLGESANTTIGWRNGYATDCNSVNGGSIPSPISIIQTVNRMHEVTKRNGRLIITRDGQQVYHMPHWVKVNSRADLQWLANCFNAISGYDITAVMEFETKHSTVDKKRG